MYILKKFIFSEKASHFSENGIAQFYDNFSKQKYLQIIDFFERKE